MPLWARPAKPVTRLNRRSLIIVACLLGAFVVAIANVLGIRVLTLSITTDSEEALHLRIDGAQSGRVSAIAERLFERGAGAGYASA